MSKTYGKKPCPLCGKRVSVNGLARSSHLNKHVREGLAVREPARYGAAYEYRYTEAGQQRARELAEAERGS